MRAVSLFAAATLFVAACNADDPETGTVAVSLTGHAPSGTTYRLRQAEIIITGPGATRVFHTEDDPDRTALSTPLPPGAYTLAIPVGWSLDRERPDGTFEPVPATLGSPNPASFTVAPGAATRVTLRFLTEGVEVVLDDGHLDVDLEVVEVDAAPSPPIDAAVDAPPPPPDAAVDATPPPPDAAVDAATPDAGAGGAVLATGDDMLPGEILLPGTSIESSARRLRVRPDGVVEILLLPLNIPVFTSGVAGSVLIMQLDGNLVLYRSDGVAVWSSDTWGHPGAYLRITGMVTIYEGSTVLWQRS
jgi:hypothetical protein